MTIPAQSPPLWSDVAAAKQAANLAKIPAEWRIKPAQTAHVMGIPRTCGVLSDTELEITERTASDLVQRMSDGEEKVYDVVLAFAKRSAIAHQLINFDAALSEARELDAAFSPSAPKGPMYGLPISLKDNFYVRGLDTTVGFVAWANDPTPVDKESQLVTLLRAAGAIVLCKTNVPTAMMMAESYNNVFGYTSNPHNTRLSSGGSSGGESSLLALKGTPLGIGTDIGGSVRIPASKTGIYALKPSFGRFTTYNARSGLPGQEAVRSINGPMSSDLASLTLYAKTIIDSQGWETDPNVVPIPWRDIALPEKLCFGILVDDGIVKPLPPVQRALEDTRKALEAAGHTVIEYKPYDTEASISIIKRLFEGDGGAKIAQVMAQSGEPWPAGLAAYSKAYADSRSAPPTVEKLWDTQVDRLSFVKKTLDHWMATKERTETGRPIDALISPTTPWAACPKYGFDFYIPYTSTWNLTDQSASVLPTGHVGSLQDVTDGYVGRNEKERDIWARYDPEESVGAPVGLQLIGMRLEEEKVLKLTEVVMAALQQS